MRAGAHSSNGQMPPRLFQSDEPLPPIMQRAMMAGKQQPNGEHQYIQQTHASADGGVDFTSDAAGHLQNGGWRAVMPNPQQQSRGHGASTASSGYGAGRSRADLNVAAWTLVDLLCMEA